MLLHCPICNKLLKDKGDQIVGGVYSVTCYDCGAFDIDINLAEILRRKYLCFNTEMSDGRDSYEANVEIFRDYIRFHQHPVLSQSVVNEMIFLRRP